MKKADMLIVMSVLADNDYQKSMAKKRAIEYLIEKKYLVRRNGIYYGITNKVAKKLTKTFGINFKDEEK